MADWGRANIWNTHSGHEDRQRAQRCACMRACARDMRTQPGPIQAQPLRGKKFSRVCRGDTPCQAGRAGRTQGTLATGLAVNRVYCPRHTEQATTRPGISWKHLQPEELRLHRSHTHTHMYTLARAGRVRHAPGQRSSSLSTFSWKGVKVDPAQKQKSKKAKKRQTRRPSLDTALPVDVPLQYKLQSRAAAQWKCQRGSSAPCCPSARRT